MKVYIDFESRSQAEIWDTGAWRYAEDPTTEVLCLAWAIDNGPVQGALRGSTLLDAITVLNRLILQGAEFHAHNALFEQAIWKFLLVPKGALPIPVRQWRCTAAKGSAHALPRRLEHMAQALGCKHEKDIHGSTVMRSLCKTTGPIDPAKLDRLLLYCKRDVEAEREIDQKLPDLSEKEQRVWFMDQYINQRGVPVDIDAVRKARELIIKETAERNAELFELTGGLVNAGTKREAIKNYLEKQGVNLPDLTKATVRTALETASGDNFRILQLRQQLSLTSTAKYASLLAAVSPDGRVRDTLIYHGAATGRWSGKLVQLQNLVKSTIKAEEIDTTIRLLKRSPTLFALSYDILPTLSSCVRGMLVPSPGHEMFITDFSAIEARVVMWLAEEAKGLKMFANRDNDPSVDDIYVQMAKVISPTATRQLGKQAVLGCIAEGSMVYSDMGFIPIETINQERRIWDGNQWVNFQERVAVGEKNVIQIENLWLTPDHLLLTNQGWQSAAEIVLSGGTQHLILGKYLEDGQLLAENITSVLNVVSLSAVNAALKKIAESTNYGAELLILVDAVARVSKGCLADAPVDTWISLLILAYENGGACVGTIFNEGVQNRIALTSKGMVLVGFEYPSNHVESSWNTLLHLMGGGLGGSLLIELIMPKGTAKEIFDSLHKEKTIETKIKKCFDLINTSSGFFQTEKFITHNCGFGMGSKKFVETCAKYEIEVDQELGDRAVTAYRTTFSAVVRFWYAMEDAVRRAIISKNRVTCGKIAFFVDGEFLRMQLPSGRTIVYHRPKVSAEGKITFMAVNSVTNKYEIEETWGGKLVENATQAVARDIMVEAMFRLFHVGYQVLFTVHDEVVGERETGRGSEKEVIALVCATPNWAEGCPINAECKKTERYKK